jgi:hypothetical protein
MREIHYVTKSEKEDFIDMCGYIDNKEGIKGTNIRAMVKNAFLHRTKFNAIHTLGIEMKEKFRYWCRCCFVQNKRGRLYRTKRENLLKNGMKKYTSSLDIAHILRSIN